MEINGIKYKSRMPEIKSSEQHSKILRSLLVMLGIFGGPKQKKVNKHGVDIVEEFKLIQQKKSKLSRQQRDSIVWQFNKLYEVDENN